MGAVCCSTTLADDNKEMLFEDSPPITPSQKAMEKVTKQNLKRSASTISDKLMAAVQEKNEKDRQGVKI